MPERVLKAKEVILSAGFDLASIGAFLLTFLPAIQSVIGVVIGMVILLINIERYKRIRRKNKNEDNGKEKKEN